MSEVWSRATAWEGGGIVLGCYSGTQVAKTTLACVRICITSTNLNDHQAAASTSTTGALNVRKANAAASTGGRQWPCSALGNTVSKFTSIIHTLTLIIRPIFRMAKSTTSSIRLITSINFVSLQASRYLSVVSSRSHVWWLTGGRNADREGQGLQSCMRFWLKTLAAIRPSLEHILPPRPTIT